MIRGDHAAQVAAERTTYRGAVCATFKANRRRQPPGAAPCCAAGRASSQGHLLLLLYNATRMSTYTHVADSHKSCGELLSASCSTATMAE